MNEFIAWYCSEPRLALNRIVVLRYRLHLENVPLAPATINLRLAAIRRLAYEASDNGLLSPELVAGIRRVKGVKRLGQRVGNWLTTEEGQQLLGAVCTDTGSVVTNILGNSVCSTSPLNKIKLGNLSAVLKAAALRCPWSQDLSSEGDL